MIVAGVVIETLPGKTASVAATLQAVEGLTIEGNDGNQRLACVLVGEHGRSLEDWAEELLESNSDIVGIFPTFVGEE